MISTLSFACMFEVKIFLDWKFWWSMEMSPQYSRTHILGMLLFYIGDIINRRLWWHLCNNYHGQNIHAWYYLSWFGKFWTDRGGAPAIACLAAHSMHCRSSNLQCLPRSAQSVCVFYSVRKLRWSVAVSTQHTKPRLLGMLLFRSGNLVNCRIWRYLL